MDFLKHLLALPSEGEHEDSLRIALEVGVQAIGAEEGSLLVFDEAAGELVFLMTAGDMLSESQLRGQRVPLGQGLTGQAAQKAQTQIGAPTYGAVQQAPHHGERAPRQVVAAPMRCGGQTLGVLTAATYRADRQFSTEQVRVFERLATLAAIVLAERRRISELEELGRR